MFRSRDKKEKSEKFQKPPKISKFNIGGQIFDVDLDNLCFLPEDSRLFTDLYKQPKLKNNNYKTLWTTSFYRDLG